MESSKPGPCMNGIFETTVQGRSMHTMVEAGQRLVIFGGVHDGGALHDVLFLENAAGKGSHFQSLRYIVLHYI